MKRLLGGRQTSLRCAGVIGLLAFFTGVCLAAADQVRMKNGDTYFGTVVSLDSETLVL